MVSHLRPVLVHHGLRGGVRHRLLRRPGLRRAGRVGLLRRLIHRRALTLEERVQHLPRLKRLARHRVKPTLLPPERERPRQRHDEIRHPAERTPRLRGRHVLHALLHSLKERPLELPREGLRESLLVELSVLVREQRVELLLLSLGDDPGVPSDGHQVVPQFMANQVRAPHARRGRHTDEIHNRPRRVLPPPQAVVDEHAVRPMWKW